MSEKNALAVLDDDPDWGKHTLTLLRAQGHNATLFLSAGKFFDALIKNRFALLILDMNLPGMPGSEIIRVLRVNPETRRMLIIGVSGEAVRRPEVIAAFEAGADEYLTKPVDADFLAARIAALLRRSAAPPEPESLKVGPLVVVPDSQEVKLNGRAVILTNMEFQLLLHFLRNANRVMTRPLLLDAVWGVKAPMETRTVDKHVESLRRKLGDFGRRFETVVKVGYLLNV